MAMHPAGSRSVLGNFLCLSYHLLVEKDYHWLLKITKDTTLVVGNSVVQLHARVSKAIAHALMKNQNENAKFKTAQTVSHFKEHFGIDSASLIQNPNFNT